MSALPHDDEAEAALLGAIVLSPSDLDEIVTIVSASDFYRPSHGHIFAACVALWEQGVRPEPVAVSAQLQEMNLLDEVGGSARLVSLMARAPGSSNAVRYAEIVAERAALRRLIHIGSELVSSAREVPADGAAALLDSTMAKLGDLHVPVGAVPRSLYEVDDFLARPDAARPPWVIPGQMRSGWRAMFVADEGIGKSVLLRQIALLAASGRHPFHPEREIPAVRSLYVDCENPDEVVEHQARLVLDRIDRHKRWVRDPHNAWIWHEPAGIDLRSRRWASAMRAVLERVRPQLVVAGPIYKMYLLKDKEQGHERAVRDVQEILGRWCQTFGFALILEHHAPFRQGGRERDLRPADSSLWLRWPEFGFRLRHLSGEAGTIELARWRGDRMVASWPTKMRPGREWPWEFVWPSGTFGGDDDF